jgi:hypothetical protein
VSVPRMSLKRYQRLLYQDSSGGSDTAIRKHQANRQVNLSECTVPGLTTSRTVEKLDGCGEKKNDKLCIEAMGSYRRGEETSGDLDILITRDISQGNRRSSKCIHVTPQYQLRTRCPFQIFWVTLLLD